MIKTICIYTDLVRGLTGLQDGDEIDESQWGHGDKGKFDRREGRER